MSLGTLIWNEKLCRLDSRMLDTTWLFLLQMFELVAICRLLLPILLNAGRCCDQLSMRRLSFLEGFFRFMVKFLKIWRWKIVLPFARIYPKIFFSWILVPSLSLILEILSISTQTSLRFSLFQTSIWFFKSLKRRFWFHNIRCCATLGSLGPINLVIKFFTFLISNVNFIYKTFKNSVQVFVLVSKKNFVAFLKTKPNRSLWSSFVLQNYNSILIFVLMIAIITCFY